MSRKSPAFSFYPNDFIEGTADFSNEEIGIYMRLLCYQWTRGPFERDRALRYVRTDVEQSFDFVLRDKFEELDGSYQNTRLECERQKQQARSESAKKAGKASGKSRKSNGSRTNPERKTNGRSTDVQRNANGSPTEVPTEKEHSDSVSDSVSVLVLESDSVSGSDSERERTHPFFQDLEFAEQFAGWDASRAEKHCVPPLGDALRDTALMEIARYAGADVARAIEIVRFNRRIAAMSIREPDRRTVIAGDQNAVNELALSDI